MRGSLEARLRVACDGNWRRQTCLGRTGRHGMKGWRGERLRSRQLAGVGLTFGGDRAGRRLGRACRPGRCGPGY